MNALDGQDHEALSEARSADAGASGAPTPDEAYAGGIHRLIEAQAARTPDWVAVRRGSQTLSYAALDQQANRLARYLRASGVDPRGKVVMCLERSPEMVAALLAVWKAGAAPVPVECTDPRAFLGRLVNEVKPAALITRGPLPGAMALLGAPVLDLDGVLRRLGSTSAEPLGVPTAADSLALQVIEPGAETFQGVAATHLQLASLLGSVASEASWGPTGEMVAATPLSTGRGILELLLPLVVGATLVVGEAAD